MAEPLSSTPEDFRSVLASVDSRGRRRWVFAHVVAGAWRRRRQVLAVLLIAIYLAAPFLSVGGQPFLRIDIPERRLWLFGQAFLPQDLSLLMLAAMLGVVGTLLAVALLGRVFCGWFCPHNVFLEMVFRPVERLWLGPAHRRLRGAPPPLWRRLGLYATYVVLAGALANTATALFVGTADFRYGLFIDPTAHPSAALFFAGFFALVLFVFAWFREQLCTIVCPYGRFQSALLDRHSLVVAYDGARGEPRRTARQSGPPAPATTATAAAAPRSGDCVDCALCVAVCPTGIDIRHGVQLECLHCTACIDACDSVMARLKRPPGLIRYASEAELSGSARRILRPRTVIYAVVLLGLLAVLAVRLAGGQDVHATQLRSSASPQRVHGSASVSDVFRIPLDLSLVNRTDHALAMRLSLPPDLAARFVVQFHPVPVPAGARIEVHGFIELPADRFSGPVLDTTLSLSDEAGAAPESAAARVTTLALRLRRP